jgi:hypothetical protein
MTRRSMSPMGRAMPESPARILAVALVFGLVLLPGCRKSSDDPLVQARENAPEIPCALGGSADFRKDCQVERTVSAEGLALVLHHPDGGFRRLLVATDGRGVVTADGADQATVSVVDAGTIEVTVGDDRYRLPATVKGQDLEAK